MRFATVSINPVTYYKLLLLQIMWLQATARIFDKFHRRRINFSATITVFSTFFRGFQSDLCKKKINASVVKLYNHATYYETHPFMVSCKIKLQLKCIENYLHTTVCFNINFIFLEPSHQATVHCGVNCSHWTGFTVANREKNSTSGLIMATEEAVCTAKHLGRM